MSTVDNQIIDIAEALKSPINKDAPMARIIEDIHDAVMDLPGTIAGKMDLTVSANTPSDISAITKGQIFTCQGSICIRDNSEQGYTELAKQANLSVKENTSNKVTSLSSNSTDTEYPSAKCVYDMIGNVESLLAAL